MSGAPTLEATASDLGKAEKGAPPRGCLPGPSLGSSLPGGWQGPAGQWSLLTAGSGCAEDAAIRGRGLLCLGGAPCAPGRAGS